MRFLKKNRFIKNMFLFIGSAFFLLSGSFILWAVGLSLPDFSSFETRKVLESTKIYDRTGKVVLYDVHADIRRTVISFDAVSRNLKNATVAIEDAEFYQHAGIKPSSFLRALLVNVGTFGFSQGGSTITQQVVKNALLTQEKTISRKLKEWVLAVKMERAFSKEEILALYINEAPYGGNIYGAEEASRAFFGKSAADLTLVEAAYLAALPQAPSYYSPYGTHRDKLDARKNLVLERMEKIGFISPDERARTTNETVTFLPYDARGIKAPHFVLYVRALLEEKYGKEMIEGGGLTVITSLDYELQKKAEEIVKTYALENEKNFNASNAGLVAIDPKTGGILVMVGSRDYFDKEIDGNFNVAVAKRQPGSAFKPFVYATAFEKGYTPETVVFDLATQFHTGCDTLGNPIGSGVKREDCYLPENYDHIYRGPVTLRNALAQSINIPAIKVLYLSGISDALRRAKDFGISTLTDASRYGLTLVLGGGEVTLLEMTSAYGVFGAGGVRNAPEAMLKTSDKSGNVLYELSPRPEQVIAEEIARQISDILSDNIARTPAFGAASALYFPDRQVAVKTGTTNDYRDAWIIGYTPSLSVGAWAGNNDNSAMEKKVAGFIVAPLWHAFMEEALKNFPREAFRAPLPAPGNLKPVLRGIWQGGETYVVDKTSGKIATEFTPEEQREERAVWSVHTILYWLDKKDPRGVAPVYPEDDSQFFLWETPVRSWAKTNGLFDEAPGRQ